MLYSESIDLNYPSFIYFTFIAPPSTTPAPGTPCKSDQCYFHNFEKIGFYQIMIFTRHNFDIIMFSVNKRISVYDKCTWLILLFYG